MACAVWRKSCIRRSLLARCLRIVPGRDRDMKYVCGGDWGALAHPNHHHTHISSTKKETHMTTQHTQPEADRVWAIELHGIEPIGEQERHGRPFELFWVWFAANIGMLGIVYG